MLIPNLKFFERKKLMSNLGKIMDKSNNLDKANDKRDTKNGKPSNMIDEKMMKDKIKNSENEMRKKSLVLMAKKSERDNSLQKLLNRLSVTVANPKYLDYSYNAMLSTNAIFGDDIAQCVDLLSTDELQLPSYAQKVSSSENRKISDNENINKNQNDDEDKNLNNDDQQSGNNNKNDKNEIDSKKIVYNKKQ